MPINFTEEQKRVFNFVEHGSGNGIIDAVAGSGKTTTIIESAKYVRNKSDALFCAFNTSISKEISKRFKQKEMDEVTVKTIHSLGYQILRQNNSTGKDIELQDKKYNTLIKDNKIKVFLEEFYRDIISINSLDPDSFEEKEKFAIKNLTYNIDRRLIDINQKFRSTLTKNEYEAFKSMVIHFGIFNQIEISKDYFDKELKCYFECHKILLNEGNSLSAKTMIIDFTDMLYLPFVWEKYPVKKFSFVFIDECQDLSKSQFAVVAKFAKRSNGRILAVGDPRQAIYGFTGADIESFQRVKDYTKPTELTLTTCFRCPQKVIEIAQTIRSDIKGNKEEKGKVNRITFDKIVENAKPDDLIISRIKAPLVILVFSFIEADVKVQIHEDEVKDIINELKNIFKQEELNNLISNFPNGFEELKQSVLRRWNWIIDKNAARIIDSTERNLYIEKENEYLKNRLEFLHKRYEVWKNNCPRIIDILKKIKLFISTTENSIKLSSIHRAKGLEAKRVFILDYDKLPMFRNEQKDWERTQEINLKYVAITRAMNKLFLIESPNIAELEDEGSLFDDMPF